MDIRISGTNFDFPISSMSLLDTLSVLLFIPIFDKLIYPWFYERRGYKITMFQRMGIGFIISCLAIISAGIIEIMRKNSDSLGDGITSTCDDDLGVSSLSVFYQVIPFVLIGMSEVCASITGCVLSLSLSCFLFFAPPYALGRLPKLEMSTVRSHFDVAR